MISIEQVKTFQFFMFISTRFALLLLQDTVIRTRWCYTIYIFSCCIVSCDVIEKGM